MSDSAIEYYNKNAVEFFKATQFVDLSELQNKFISLLNPKAKILDFGCGSGRDSKFFISRGFDIVAMDGSAELCKLASEYIGQDVICATFDNFEPTEKFEGIWACSSLVHLKNEEIPAMLKKLSNMLKSNGILQVSFKHGDFYGQRKERHFTNMTEERFKIIVDKISSLTIESIDIKAHTKTKDSNEEWIIFFLRKK